MNISSIEGNIEMEEQIKEKTNIIKTPDSNNRQNSTYSCDENDWQNAQYCLCRPGEKLKGMRSSHNIAKEDRKWILTCAPIMPTFTVNDPSEWYSKSNWNNWEQTFHWTGVYTDSFIVGIQSYYDNGPKDRRYQVFHTRSDNWVLASISGWSRLNNWENPVDRELADDEVFVELYSHHSNRQEDRIFWVKTGRPVPRCNQLLKITYDYNNINEKVTEGVAAGQAVFDNRESTSSASFTVSISATDQAALSDSYSFQRTFGWEAAFDLQVTTSVMEGGGIFPSMASHFITSNFSSKFPLSSTFDKSDSKSYSKENGHKMTYTADCAPGCYCVFDVNVKRATGEIPYVMSSTSTGRKNPYSKIETDCLQIGVLTYAKTFDAEATTKCLSRPKNVTTVVHNKLFKNQTAMMEKQENEIIMKLEASKNESLNVTLNYQEKTILHLNDQESKLKNVTFSFQFLQEFRSGSDENPETEAAQRKTRNVSPYTKASWWFSNCPSLCKGIPSNRKKRRYKRCCIHPTCNTREDVVSSKACHWFFVLQGNNKGKIFNCYLNTFQTRTVLPCQIPRSMGFGAVKIPKFPKKVDYLILKVSC